MSKHNIINNFEKESDSPKGVGWKYVEFEQYRFLYDASCFMGKNEIESSVIANCIFLFLLEKPNDDHSYYWIFTNEERTTELFLGEHRVNVHSLVLDYPKSINEKIDRILLNLHKIIKTFGDRLPSNILANYPRLFLPEADVISSSVATIYNTVCKMGLFDKETSTFTIAGWQRIDELASKRKKESKQIFIASKFLNNKETIDAIKQAISDEEYIPISLYEYQTNDYIMPEMFGLIDHSIALVADITEENPNVMFEVGYAKGIGIDIILISKSNINDNGEIEKPIHSFDISQISIVYYKDLADLKSKLSFRIKNTIKVND